MNNHVFKINLSHFCNKILCFYNKSNCVFKISLSHFNNTNDDVLTIKWLRFYNKIITFIPLLIQTINNKYHFIMWKYVVLTINITQKTWLLIHFDLSGVAAIRFRDKQHPLSWSLTVNMKASAITHPKQTQMLWALHTTSRRSKSSLSFPELSSSSSSWLCCFG